MKMLEEIENVWDCRFARIATSKQNIGLVSGEVRPRHYAS